MARSDTKSIVENIQTNINKKNINSVSYIY